mgnify:FL=1|jgi:hypothetical protein|tara:strand:+ start:255 stop:434 length:180 start_codon:yes stop_codon:yes gene_type:complete
MAIQLDHIEQLIMNEILYEMGTGDFWINAGDEEVQEMLEILWMRLNQYSDTRDVQIAVA